MYANQYEEHLAFSAPDSSHFDGFDRGTMWDDEAQQETNCIGRMTSEAGYKVCIMETTCIDGDLYYEVQVNGKITFDGWNCKDRAIRIARWWMDGSLTKCWR